MSLTARYLRPYAPRAVLYVLLVVGEVLFTMATALSVADFLRILFGDGGEASTMGVNVVAQWLDGLYGWLIAHGKRMALLLFSVLIFVLYGMKNVFGYLAAVQVATLRTLMVRDMRNDMFDKAMRLPAAYYDRTRKGDMMARFGNDMTEYDEGVLGSVQMFSVAVVSMVLYMAMLLYLNVKLTLFVLCMLPLVAVVISGLSRRLKRQSKEIQEAGSRLISTTDETIGGLKVIKAYTAIETMNARFAQRNRAYAKRRTAMFRRIYSASPISDFLGNTIVVCILLFGAWLVQGGDQSLTAELFISYVMLFVLMIPPAKELTTAIAQMRKGRACADRIAAFLDEEEESDCEGAPADVPSDAANMVELRDVDFSYVEGETVLHGVSLMVPTGTTVALVGASGSGKSTIADLVCRLYDPTAGSIAFAGCDVRRMSRAALRRQIGVVTQDTLLFNDTVEANIAFGSEGASHDEVVRAAQAAQAHDFIAALPQGYDTCIGEGGGQLSGGQRQRLSIARALLRNPRLLILDEATSALDTESERQLQATLDSVMANRTAIVIAHRLSTVVEADKIVVLDKGRVVEQGTHGELIARGGRYAELVALQTLT